MSRLRLLRRRPPNRSARRSEGRRAPRGERGASLVEAAIVIPVLAAVLLSTVELGLMLRAKHVVTQAAASAARAAAGQGADRLADYAAIDAAVATVADTRTELVAIVVFRPTESGEMPHACASQSVNNVCNYYSEQFLNQFRQQAATPTGGQVRFAVPCSGAVDGAWCPPTRDARQAGGLDDLGVTVILRRKGLTGIFGDSQLIRETSITQLEPEIS